MARPISISIVSDVKEFLRGTGDATEALGKVSDALDDVAKDAQRSGKDAGNDLSRGIEGGTKDAAQATDKLERSFKDLATAAKKESKVAGKAIDTEIDHGTTKAKQTLHEFKSEAKQNFGETASSFDGSMESAVSGIQGTFGGLATVLGPAGAIGAGLIGAAIGVGASIAQGYAESAEQVKETISNMYDDMLESGQQYLSKEFVQQAIADMFKDDGKRQQMIQDAATLGISVSDLATAYATEGDTREEVSARILAAMAEEEQKIKDLGSITTDDEAAKIDAYNQRIKALEGVAGKLDSEKEKVDKAKASVDSTRKAWNEVDVEFSKHNVNSLKGIETQGQRLQGYADKLRGLPNPTLKLDLDTGDAETKLRGFLAERSLTINANIRPGAIIR